MGQPMLLLMARCCQNLCRVPAQRSFVVTAGHYQLLGRQSLPNIAVILRLMPNNGYGTRQHQQALEKYGISPHHRRSFAPIKRLVETAKFTPIIISDHRSRHSQHFFALMA